MIQMYHRIAPTRTAVRLRVWRLFRPRASLIRTMPLQPPPNPDAVIPDGPPTGATVKVDGVLGISYRHRGQVRWTTRGRIAQRLWQAQHRAVQVPLNWTLLAEIVTPETKIIIDYEGAERLVVLGARHLDRNIVLDNGILTRCYSG